MMFAKNRPVRSKKLRDSAKGQKCSVRIPSVCNFDETTTVLAHTRCGGMGTKSDDTAAAFCCSSCHDALDGRVSVPFTRLEIDFMHLSGIIETQHIWIDAGLIKVEGHEI